MECQWIRTTEHSLPKLREAAQGVALLPLGSIESHGPHAPIGSDPLTVEHLLTLVAQQETVAILPVLPYSFVASATRLLGAIHIDSLLLIQFVENICDELHRNGFGKIIVLHGHGGNPALHATLCKRVLERAKPYAVYSIAPLPDMAEFIKGVVESKHTGHACEFETSLNLASVPELVHLEYLEGRDFKPQACFEAGGVLTPVDWTARWPEMAVGEPLKATREKGEKLFAEWARRVVEIIRKVKRDETVPRVMAEFARARQSHRG